MSNAKPCCWSAVPWEVWANRYSVPAFSGDSLQPITLQQIKTEHYGNVVALRISSLEPEHYTRASVMIRHITAQLMQQPTTHRLLLLLSNHKPNDIDDYGSRYSVEDMRQTVIKARMMAWADQFSASVLVGAPEETVIPKQHSLWEHIPTILSMRVLSTLPLG